MKLHVYHIIPNYGYIIYHAESATANLITLQVLRLSQMSPEEKWDKKGSSPRNNSNAECLRPRVYSNINDSTAERSWQCSLTITHDFKAAICTFWGLYVPFRALGPYFLGSCHDYSRLLTIKDVLAMFFLSSGTSRGTSFVSYMDLLFFGPLSTDFHEDVLFEPLYFHGI